MSKDRPAGTDSRNAGSRKVGPDDKKYIIQLTKKGFFGLIVVLLVGFIWVFIFGIILGRGYRPEAAIPELAAVLPNKTASNQTLNITEPLRAEELEFHSRLQTKTTRVDKVDTRVDPTASRPAPKPAEAPIQAPVVAKPPQEQPRPAVKAEDESGERYTWIYQVAAFKEQGGAERLKKQIEARGLTSNVRRSDGFYKVQMHFSGTQPERKAAVTILNDMGFEKPILVFKERLP